MNASDSAGAGGKRGGVRGVFDNIIGGVVGGVGGAGGVDGDGIGGGGRVLRFVLAGCWNTAFVCAVYAFFLWLGAPYYLALFFCTAGAVVNNWLTLSLFVFADRERGGVLRYLGGLAAGYVFSVAVVGFFVEILLVNPYWAGFFALPLTVAFSFSVNNFLVFRAKRR